MKLPNKVTSYSNSILPKLCDALNVLKKGNISPLNLYKKLKNKTQNVAEFLEILDCLYLLGKIRLSENTEELQYVETN